MNQNFAKGKLADWKDYINIDAICQYKMNQLDKCSALWFTRTKTLRVYKKHKDANLNNQSKKIISHSYLQYSAEACND